MEDPHCLSIDEMKLLKVGETVTTIEHGIKWRVVSVEADGIEAERVGGIMSAFMPWDQSIKLELPDDFWETRQWK